MFPWFSSLLWHPNRIWRSIGAYAVSVTQNLEKIYLRNLDGFLPALLTYHVEDTESQHGLSQWKSLSNSLSTFGEEDSWCDPDFLPFAWQAHGNSVVPVGPQGLHSLNPIRTCTGDIPAAYLGNYFLRNSHHISEKLWWQLIQNLGLELQPMFSWLQSVLPKQSNCTADRTSLVTSQEWP